MIRSRFFFSGGGYTINNSLRFNQADTAYMTRTPSVTGDRKTWTFSAWVKRGSRLDAINYIFHGHATARSALRFNASGTILITLNSAIDGNAETYALYRDPSAWYHIVLAFDTTQATASNRIKLWVNGTLASFNAPSYPAQNYLSDFNEATTYMGIGANGSTTYDGLLSEVNVIDGQALDASYFGKSDNVTGAWVPIKYSGSYGTNGFYLKFNDATSTTTLGYDRSGNGNNWTLTNFAATDQLTDTPTNNFATWNPLASAGTTITYSDGNLVAANTVNAVYSTQASILVPAARKFYTEIKISAVSDPYRLNLGFTSPIKSTDYISAVPGLNVYVNLANDTISFQKDAAAAFYSVAGSFVLNDIFGFAYDATTRNIWVSKNGTWFNSGDPTNGTNALTTLTTGYDYGPAAALNVTGAGNSVTLNAGQYSFAYTPPTGFKSLCTDNLPVPSIKKPALYFKPVLYTGNGAVRSIIGVGFTPDLSWIKSRSNVLNHMLTDSIRGVTKRLSSNLTDAEATDTNGLTSFDADGFSLGTDANYNTNAATYVAWNWKKGVVPGLDIVSYSGTGVAHTIAHSLGVAPKFLVVKNMNAVSDWFVYHLYGAPLSQPQYGRLALNSTGIFIGDSGVLNDTAPGSASFTVGTSVLTNANGQNYGAYLFAEIPGFSRFGKYTGNGSADGPFVWCGFKPRYVLIKNVSRAGPGWLQYDSVRQTYNVNDNIFNLADSAAEGNPGGNPIDVLSNGFKCRVAGLSINTSGEAHIFVAFAEYPFKYAKAV